MQGVLLSVVLGKDNGTSNEPCSSVFALVLKRDIL